MKVSHTPLSVQIADKIKNMIISDHIYSPGERLPSEAELCREFAISRSTLREAVRTLCAQGILQIERGRGTFVSHAPKIEADLALLNEQIISTDLKEIYELRLVFEPQAAYFAALRATDRDIAKIWEYGVAIEHFIELEDIRWLQYEFKFHQAIAEASHNSLLLNLMPIFEQAHQANPDLLSSYNLAKDSLIDHRNIMDFIKRGYPQGAQSAMHLHIINIMKSLNLRID